MSEEILEPKLTSIRNLLNGNNKFIVPPFQRSFDWEIDQATELWEDILYATEKKSSEYFLGTIVLAKEEHNNFKIIDGQQRLTCISMIFSAICGELEARNDNRYDRIFSEYLGSKGYERDATIIPKLELNQINNETFNKYVIERKPENIINNVLKNKLHSSNRKLLKVYSFFLNKINEGASKRGVDYDDFIVPIVLCLGDTLKLIEIPVSSEEGAYLIFESVNARGKELAVSDLLKNRLYYESGKEINRAQTLWDKMETELSGNSIPEYIRHFWIARKAQETNLNVREKKLYKEVLQSLPVIKDTIGSRTARENETIKLLNELSESATSYASLSDFNLWPTEQEYNSTLEEMLKELEMFRVKQCYPTLLNIIQKFKKPREIVKGFGTIVNFSFRYNVIGKESSGALELIFGKLAYEIRVGKYTSSQDITDYLLAVNSDIAFRTAFTSTTITKRQNKLGRYILAKIENTERQQKGESLSTIDFEDKRVSLEHILPQNEKVHVDWEAYFSPNVDSINYIYRLGNLTLMDKKSNRLEGDGNFQQKQNSLKNSDMQIDSYIESATKWGDREIEQRQEHLAKFAVQAWKL